MSAGVFDYLMNLLMKFLGMKVRLQFALRLITKKVLALYVGADKFFRPGANMARAAFSDGCEIRHIRFQMVGFRGAIYKMKHGTDFSGGAASDREEDDEFRSRATLESFGNVIGNGEGGVAKLITQIDALSKEAIVGKPVDAVRQIHGSLPDGKVFKPFVFHGTTSFS